MTWNYVGHIETLEKLLHIPLRDVEIQLANMQHHGDSVDLH